MKTLTSENAGTSGSLAAWGRKWRSASEGRGHGWGRAWPESPTCRASGLQRPLTGAKLFPPAQLELKAPSDGSLAGAPRAAPGSHVRPWPEPAAGQADSRVGMGTWAHGAAWPPPSLPSALTLVSAGWAVREHPAPDHPLTAREERPPPWLLAQSTDTEII